MVLGERNDICGSWVMVVVIEALDASLGEATTGADLGGSSKYSIYVSHNDLERKGLYRASIWYTDGYTQM